MRVSVVLNRATLGRVCLLLRYLGSISIKLQFHLFHGCYCNFGGQCNYSYDTITRGIVFQL